MKKIISLLIFFIITINFIFTTFSFAQSNCDWAKGAGSSNNEVGMSITVDGNGNFIVTGNFKSSSVSFGTNTLTNNGSDDIYIVKYDSNGNVIWAKSAGGSGTDNVKSITCDGSGNIYITGFFASSSISFGATILSLIGMSDIFIAKYDANGNSVWAKSSGGNSYDTGYSINIDVSGNVYVCGDFASSSLTFNAMTVTNSSSNYYDIFLVKFDINGNTLWVKSAGGANNHDHAYSIISNASGIYMVGDFESYNTLTFGSTTLNNSVGGTDIFVVKFDLNGNALWAKSAGGPNAANNNANSVTTDLSGNIYVVGRFSTSSITFGSTTLNNTGSGLNFFLAKYNSNGSELWAIGGGGNSSTSMTSVTSDIAGNIYAVGYHGGSSIAFGTATLSDQSGFDFIVKYDTNGNVLWAKKVGNNSIGDFINSAIADAYGNVFITGVFQSPTIIFGLTTLTNSGLGDSYIAKVGPCMPITTTTSSLSVSCNAGNDGSANVAASGCSPQYSYLWGTTPIQTTATITGLSMGTYSVTVIDPNGCSVTNSVTVNQIPTLAAIVNATATSCNGTCNGILTASQTGGTSPYTYSWSSSLGAGANKSNVCPGNYTVTITDANGCTANTNATISQPPAITININSTNVSCYGGSNGSAIAAASTGNPPYTYVWSNNVTSFTITGLSIGNYSVIVTDANGCTKSQNVIIAQPPVLSATYNSSTINKCSGTCTGTSSLNVSGGTSPYSYLWGASANNQTTQTASGLCAGSYSAVITDANRCTLNKQVTLTPVSAVNPEVYLTNIAAVDMVSVSPAFAAYYTYDLPAAIVPNSSNPRNFVDPGKYARFKVQCENKKSNGQSIVSGSCKVRTNSAFVTLLTDSSSALNNIAWNAKAWSADEFEVYIKPTTPPGSNIYVDFVVQENANNYSTTCIAIPVTPLVYSPTTAFTIDDDNNPDSNGNNDDICNPGETIEFYPWMDNVSTLNAEYVRGSFENLDTLSYINIWNNVSGISGIVYSTSWWNYTFSQPQTIPVGQANMTPKFDFVFDYNNSSMLNNFQLYMVMAGGFKLFGGSALSLVQWTLPYTFNSTTTTPIEENSSNRKINIYPNPFCTQTALQTDIPLRNATLTVDNLFGQTVAQIKNISGQIIAFNRDNLPSGLYFVRLTDLPAGKAGENNPDSYRGIAVDKFVITDK